MCCTGGFGCYEPPELFYLVQARPHESRASGGTTARITGSRQIPNRTHLSSSPFHPLSPHHTKIAAASIPSIPVAGGVNRLRHLISFHHSTGAGGYPFPPGRAWPRQRAGGAAQRPRRAARGGACGWPNPRRRRTEQAHARPAEAAPGPRGGAREGGSGAADALRPRLARRRRRPRHQPLPCRMWPRGVWSRLQPVLAAAAAAAQPPRPPARDNIIIHKVKRTPSEIK